MNVGLDVVVSENLVSYLSTHLLFVAGAFSDSELYFTNGYSSVLVNVSIAAIFLCGMCVLCVVLCGVLLGDMFRCDGWGWRVRLGFFIWGMRAWGGLRFCWGDY